jgi:alkylation response protein AidB-like acyl-CoA dehydrogenase
MPLKLPGVEIHAIHTLQEERTNIVYFSDVRVPDKYRLGEVGDGARVMSSALGFEHGGAAYQAAQAAMTRHALAWSRKPGKDGKAPLEDPAARRVLATAVAHTEIADTLCRLQAWAGVEKAPVPAIGAMAKLFSTEALCADAAAIVALAAPESLVRGLDPDLDRVELYMRRGLGMTIYGGTSEVHRSVIAEKVLGMPKSR